MLANKWMRKAVLMIAAVVGLVASPAFAHEGHMASHADCKGVELRQALRDLWIDHVFWVRNVAYSTRMGDMAAAKVAEEDVVANAKAIAGAIAPLYGQPASDKLFGLLAGHYGAVKEYMNASYAGNQAAKEAASGKINANADEIAGFLSSANKNWPKRTLVSLLIAHGAHHMAEIDDFAMNDYRGEAEIWEAMKTHMYMIADALAAGIVKQFPAKF
jgi:hypothetical protein